jgi:hypothetical protein
MKTKEKQYILSDDVLIFAHRKRLWRNGITPKHKLSDEVVEFLLFLESHNALFDFIDTFRAYEQYRLSICSEYETTPILADYFKGRDPKWFLRGAFQWQFAGHYKTWNGLNELWNNQIKK